MKTTQILTLILGLMTATLTRGQEADSLMKQVLEHNRLLQAAREASRTSILRAGTGNTPPDPEVEFGYLFGDPSGIGNKINIVVKQKVDFPTAYIHRSRLREIRSSRAELEYLLVRQEVLSEARQLWIEELHLKQLDGLLEERLRRAQTVRDHMEAMMDAGEAGPLEYNQARLMLAAVEGEYEEVQAGLENSQLALAEICGGRSIVLSDTLFPDSQVIFEDSLLEAYRYGPGALLYRQDRAEKENEEKLARSAHLPKLSAGYFSESIPSEAFRGFTLGLSLPLWENSRQVKTARSALLQSEAEAHHYLLEQETELRQKLRSREKLLLRVERLEDALNSANSMDLLAASLENGETSLAEYFYTSDFYFRNQQLLLKYQRDLLVLEAELLKIQY